MAGMKRFCFTLIALACMAATAQTQALPSAPAPQGSADWNRVRALAPGQAIVVVEDNAPPLHCLFTSATDTYLFCAPPGNPQGVGFRLDRANILSVDFDLPPQNSPQVRRPQPNYHPAWIASMIAGGLITGIVATGETDAGTAAKAGLIGAVVVGAIGAPLAFLPQPGSQNFARRGAAFQARIPLPHSKPHYFRIR